MKGLIMKSLTMKNCTMKGLYLLVLGKGLNLVIHLDLHSMSIHHLVWVKDPILLKVLDPLEAVCWIDQGRHCIG